MRTFLDVSVQGIQRYLGRTPDLKGRRGASAWLSEATSRERLPSWIAGQHELVAAGVQVNPEAGQADGVVPLWMPAEADPGTVAGMVIDRLRGLLPGLHLHAAWGTAPSYVEAYRAWKAAPDPRASMMVRPGTADFPPVETCGQCRLDPALLRTRIHEEEPWLCADCLGRYHERYRWPGLDDDAVPVGAESELLSRLGRNRQHVAADFAGLAALGEQSGNRNHLATVFADGNAIGALFERVIAGGDPTAKQTASRAVAKATRDALHVATEAVLDGDSTARVPVIPHVVGGDDLLVSVVADKAWAFVTTYLREFTRCLAAEDALRPYLDWDGAIPGASAGVVFAHSSFPFRRSVELATEALGAAKKAHAGRQPAVLWLDVTREGEQPPPQRAAWTLTTLNDLSQALTELRSVPSSGRATLEQLIDVDDPTLSSARLREHARRLSRDRVLEPFLTRDTQPGDMVDGDSSVGAMSVGTSAVGTTSVARLADALALVRWWR